MDLKIIKKISRLLLVVVWLVFFFTGNKDLILLILLLVINGILIETKNDLLLLIIIFIGGLSFNIYQGVNGNEKFYIKAFYISVLFCINFLFPFFIGLIFRKILKSEKIFHLGVIWIFTFIVCQTELSFLNKDFISAYPWISPLVFNVNFFISGFFISNFIDKTKSFLIIMIFPLLLVPIIVFTSDNNYFEPLIFLISTMLSSSLGFIISKFLKRRQVR